MNDVTPLGFKIDVDEREAKESLSEPTVTAGNPELEFPSIVIKVNDESLEISNKQARVLWSKLGRLLGVLTMDE